MSAERWSRDIGLTLSNIVGTPSDDSHAHAPPPVVSHRRSPSPALELPSWTGGDRNSSSSTGKPSMETSLPPTQRASSASLHGSEHINEEWRREGWGTDTGGGEPGKRYEDSMVQDEPLRVPPGVINVGTHYALRPILVRRHILMITISGTLGVGICINSGQILNVAGSGGSLLALALTGLIMHCVLVSLSELISLIPEAGALQEYPMRFVDDALGWTCAAAYWFGYSMGLPTLCTSTAILIRGLGSDVADGWIITIVLAVVIIINVFGVKVYAEIEYAGGFLKILLLIGLIVAMLVVSAEGKSGPSAQHVQGLHYWTAPYRFPPTFPNTATNDTTISTQNVKPEISGSVGQFLSVWKAMTLLAFSFIGTEIVAVSASEAKYPRDDLPRATRRVFWTTFSLYVAAIFFVSLNVPHSDPNLLNLYDTRQTQGHNSPFTIALTHAGIKTLPKFLEVCFLFASWSTLNTTLFVASRTLYGMATRLSIEDHPHLTVLARTTPKGVPMTALFASCIFAPLAYLQCGGRNPQLLLSIFSQVETVAIVIVWMCQCIAFLRFYGGLQSGGAPYDRLARDYPYRGNFQPWTAWLGTIGCGLLVLFNGFDVFMRTPFDGGNFLAAYLAVILFVLAYIIMKIVRRSQFVRKSQMRYSVRREKFDQRRGPESGGKLRRFLRWVFN